MDKADIFGPGGLRAPCVLMCARRSLAIVITIVQSFFLSSFSGQKPNYFRFLHLKISLSYWSVFYFFIYPADCINNLIGYDKNASIHVMCEQPIKQIKLNRIWRNARMIWILDCGVSWVAPSWSSWVREGAINTLRGGLCQSRIIRS